MSNEHMTAKERAKVLEQWRQDNFGFLTKRDNADLLRIVHRLATEGTG